jgi:hypothetical protein
VPDSNLIEMLLILRVYFEDRIKNGQIAKTRMIMK